MSNLPPTKKTLAQLWAEKVKRYNDLDLGIDLCTDLFEAYELLGFKSTRRLGEVCFHEEHTLERGEPRP